MPRNRESALQTKVVQIVFGLVLLGIVVFATKSMMFGSTMIAKTLAAAIVGATVIFALDRRYWLLSAFLFGFYDTIPYLKFTGAELGALILVSVFFIRMALRHETGVFGLSPIFLASLPFMVWMCIVWSLHPTGMLIFGSSSIGGRFYFKVILAFFAMLCLSRFHFSDNDCKLLLFSIASGYLSCIACSLVFGNTEMAFARTGLHYTFNHMSFVAPILLCRFSAPELLTRPLPLFLFLCTFGLAVYSGNRTSAARPALVGLLVPVFTCKDRIKTFALFLVASIVLLVTVAGHGSVWNLPFAIQRSLSFLPGKWDQRLEVYGFNDDFRTVLRMYAKEHIRERPWFGDGGFSLNASDMVWAASHSSIRDGFSGHVLARNWHNVWLGLAADFGIPISIAWAFFTICLVIVGWRQYKTLQPTNWSQTAYLYFYLLILVEIVNGFFNGGHSSLTVQLFFFWSGWLMAVRNGIQRQSISSSQRLYDLQMVDTKC